MNPKTGQQLQGDMDTLSLSNGPKLIGRTLSKNLLINIILMWRRFAW
jgi:hypothetical protein